MKTKRNQLLYCVFGALAILGCSDTAQAQINTIAVSPTTLSFNTANGQPQPVTVTVGSGTSSVPYTVAVAVPAGGPLWLGTSSSTGTTPGTFQATPINSVINGLATGTYTATITVTPTNGTAVMIPAMLSVGGSGTGPATYTASQNPVPFNVAVGSAPSSQQVTLTSSGALTTVNLIPINVSGGQSWLGLSPTTLNVGSGTQGIFTVTATPGTLPAGSYTGTIQVIPANSSTSVLNIPVNLTVGSSTGTGVFTPSQTSLSFNFPSTGSPSTQQTIQLSNSSNNFDPNVAVTASTTSGGSWLFVTPATLSVFPNSTNQSSITVTANPSGLVSGGTYQGNIAITSSVLGNLNIPVTLTVGQSGNSLLTASPNPITIGIPAGSNTPVNSQVLVGTSGQPSLVSASISGTGLSWITVNPPSQNVTPGSTSAFTVTANPAGISSGTYQGFVTFTPAVGGNTLSVPLSVTVGSAPSITVSPGALQFAYQIGTALPPAQAFNITSTAASTAFSVTPTTQSGGNWLVVNQQTGVTSATSGSATPISVQINSTGLQPGTYQGTITVTGNGISNSPQTVAVTLLVSNQPIITYSPATVTFNHQAGSTTLPQPQQIQVTSSGNPLSYNVTTAPGSGGNWLQVTPSSGNTPGALSLSVNPAVLAGLAPGTYSSTVTVTSFGAGNTTTNIQVTLVIGNNPLISVSQSSLSFNYQTSQAVPAAQTLTVNSTAGPLNFTVASATSNCTSGFLNVSPASGLTPATLAVSITVQGLVAGTCNGTITLTAPGAGNSPLTIPVSVQVSATPLINISPGAINITTQAGSAPPNQIVSLTSTDPTVALPFNVTSTTNNGGGWLLVGPTSGTTPANLTVGFQTSGLLVGTYTGSITVMPTTAGQAPTVIPVTLVVSSSATAAATPSSLTFTQPFSGPAPAAQTVQITSSGTAGLTYSATATTLSGGNWLSVSNASGITPGTITVSANGSNLGQGSYSGVVTVQIPGAANATLSIPVTLNVTAAQTLTVSAATATFNFQQGATATPALQTIQVGSTGATSIPFTATLTSATNGLFTVTPASGATPATLTLGLNQSVLSTLNPGTYTGQIAVATPGGGSQTINLSVVIAAAPLPALGAVVNAASGASGPVAPGEIIELFGTNVGPVTAQGLQLTATGAVATTLGNTQVTFDGIPAPLIYVSSGQVNAIVPYEVAGRVSTNVVVSRNGVSSTSLQLLVATTSPAIFSASQGGNGQGAILNANSTPNNASNPAAAGTVIQIFATGEGAVVPGVATGSVTPVTSNPPKPVAVPTVTIGGAAAQVVFYGEAPGLVSGVLQVNVVLPMGIGSGPKTVVLNAGGNSNQQQQVTVQVQ